MDAHHAEQLVRDLLAPLPQRIAHVLAVGAKAEELGRRLTGLDQELLVVAALLHDVGYAPQLVDTGLHPLDGARWLSTQGKGRLARLVANHTTARFEAIERGLGAALDAFPPLPSLEADLLTYCDLVTGPEGSAMTFDERVTDIEQRYRHGHPVTRALHAALPDLAAIIDRVDGLLLVAPDPLK